MRFGFRSQIAVLVIGVLFIAQIVGLWLFVDERSLAVQAAIGSEAAGRAANVARLIEASPPRLHDQIIAAATSPLVRFELAGTPSVPNIRHDGNGAVEARIRALLDEGFTRDIRVEIRAIEQTLLPLPNLSPEMALIHSEMMQGTLATIEMEISIAVTGGKWLNLATRFERPPIQWSLASTLSFVLTASALLFVIFWFLLTRLTRPLNDLAGAAESLGRGARLAEIPVRGPREVKELASAFNQMQGRLERFVSDRTQMLAALAHDLRTPLTALRVRAEMVDDKETREGISSSLDEMQSMADATLAYARGVVAGESQQSIDIASFLSEIVSSMPGNVALTPGPSATLQIQPGAMRRALRNIIENACRYGERAAISWVRTPDGLEIRIDDSGPGIPEQELDSVFEPFNRLERSRSRETGGHGLGLSIARSVVLQHGGGIKLINRSGKGLRVKVALPLAEQLDPEQGVAFSGRSEPGNLGPRDGSSIGK